MIPVLFLYSLIKEINRKSANTDDYSGLKDNDKEKIPAETIGGDFVIF